MLNDSFVDTWTPRDSQHVESYGALILALHMDSFRMVGTGVTLTVAPRDPSVELNRRRRTGYSEGTPVSAIRRVAATSSRVMPGSCDECPASGTTTRSASGQASFRSTAFLIGHTMS